VFAARRLIVGTVVVLSTSAIAATSAVAMPFTPIGSSAPSATFSRQDKQLVPAVATSPAPTPKRHLATGATAHSFSSTDAAITAGLAVLALVALAGGIAITRSRTRRGEQRPALSH
jgi:hypothetical protein